MRLQKFRWSKVYESSEEELVEFLRARNITAERWVAEVFDKPEQRSLNQGTTFWCAEGSWTFRTSGDAISMQPGDGLYIPANVAFKMDVGMSGFVCYESATPANR